MTRNWHCQSVKNYRLDMNIHDHMLWTSLFLKKVKSLHIYLGCFSAAVEFIYKTGPRVYDPPVLMKDWRL